MSRCCCDRMRYVDAVVRREDGMRRDLERNPQNRTVTKFLLWPRRDSITQRLVWMRRAVIEQKMVATIQVLSWGMLLPCTEWRTTRITAT